MRLIGYGEDALTYQSLTHRLPDFLRKVGDSTLPADAVVLFRPSFGRRAGAKHGGRASPFGEFDGIVGTSQGVYLVEAKWSRSGEAWKPVLELRPEQVRRHAVLRWYLERWRAETPASWLAFATQSVIEAFEAAFPGMTVPGPTTVLADSLGYVLAMLEGCGPIHDILLYCDIDGRECPPITGLKGFSLINMPVSGAHVSGFFSMGDSGMLPVAGV